MCGFFGVFERDGATLPCSQRLEASARALRHRGHDGCGTFREPGIGLVHTRLALVDLDPRSAQPMWDSTGRYGLVYNGELYDYGHLREQLIGAGVVLRTSGDTEILLKMLVHFGIEETLTRVDGMFAFGLYDRKEKSLVVGRDRLGIKPCYVWRTDRQFIFASSITALRPWCEFAPDSTMLTAYLQGHGGPTTGQTFFEGIEILPPGNWLEIRSGRDKEGRRAYFHLNDLHHPDLAQTLATESVSAQIDRVEHALNCSVEGQLRADARIGGLCSGGVDSSLVLAIAARLRPGIPLFHADVVGRLSEANAAQSVARFLRIPFHKVEVHDRDFIELMPSVTEHFGYPFGMHPNAVSFLMVSRMARENGVKAVLCGEGADECFLGYAWLSPNIRTFLKRLPKRAWRHVSNWVSQAERRIRRKDPSPIPSADDLALVRQLQTGFEKECGPILGLAGDLRQIPFPSGGPADQQGLLFFVLRSLLHRNDSMGMAAGIESRFPFLNHDLMRLAINLPLRSKIRFSPLAGDWKHLFLREKWILRQVARRYLPRQTAYRQKIAFPANAYKRMRVSRSWFDDSFVADHFRLSRTRLDYLLERASSNLRIRLLQIDVWGRLFVGGHTAAELSAALPRYVGFGDKVEQDATREPRIAA